MTRRVPTSPVDWRRMAWGVRSVLSHPRRLVLALLVGFVVLTLLSVAQEWRFVVDILGLPHLSVRERAAIILDRYPVVGTAYEPLRGWLLVSISAEMGVIAALVSQQEVRLSLSESQGVAGTAGVVFGAFGAGCAACGATILAGILSAFGMTGLLVVLPWHGVEFLALGALGLLVSLHHVSGNLDGR